MKKIKIFIALILVLGLYFFVNKITLAREGGPAALDPDINIRLRGLVPANFSGVIIPHPENTDTRQPRLGSVFSPSFGSFFQVKDRNGQGIDSSNITSPGATTLIPKDGGGTVLAPLSGYPIGGGFYYTVLYASDSDIVIHAGTDDSAAVGYTIHFLNIIVNPDLKRMYDENEASGRKQLLAIPCRQVLGTTGNEVTISIRDSGSFMDPRFEDWWSESPAANCNGNPGFVDIGTTPGTDVKPYDLTEEIPCTDTTNPEFHSLRPYPASPCLKKIQDTALLCSNDLVVIKPASPAPGYESSRSAIGADGTYTVTYSNVPMSSGVSIDLTNAELPIIGNTEDVPNATWTSVNTKANNLSEGQRVNNYLSWYLNGVINRAEQDFLSNDSNDSDLNNMKYLINYSGPLAKLLPLAGQTINKIISVNNADQTKNGNPTPDGGGLTSESEENRRHNQIVGCPLGKNLILPCYLFDLQTFIDTAISHGLVGDIVGQYDVQSILDRLIAFVSNKRPVETDPKYNSFQDYWRDYMIWRGNFCPYIPFTRFYFCADVDLNLMSVIFNLIPNSTTEDRVGTIGTNQTSNTAPGCSVQGAPCQAIRCADGTNINADSCPGSTPQNVSGTFASCSQWANEACSTHGGTSDNPNNTSVNLTSPGDVTFTPSNGTNNMHNLYFAHVQETAELANQLQNTFKSKDAISSSGTTKDPEIGPGCTILDTRTNSGDNLYGNIDRVTEGGYRDQKIEGTVNFKASYTCTYSPTVLGGTEYNVTCGNATASLSIFTQSPEVGNIWDTLVGGTQAAFRRFFPKVGVDSPVTEIKEIPAETQVKYVSNQDQVAAGNGSSGAGSSATAQVYIPFVGGIKDYFLDGIQTALRPKGMGSSQAISDNSGVVNPGGATGSCSYLGVSIPAAMQAAAGKYRIPVELLQGIFMIEGSDYTANPANYKCSRNFATALGLMQVTDGTYSYVTSSSEKIANDEFMCFENTTAKSRCEPYDEMELASRVLLSKIGRLNYSTMMTEDGFTLNLDNAIGIYRAACFYYGSCYPDRATVNAAVRFIPSDRWRGGSAANMGYADLVCAKMALLNPSFTSCTNPNNYPPRQSP